MRRIWSSIAVGSMVVAIAACNGDDDSSDESTPPVPSATTGSTVESSEPATTESTTTAPESTTSELNPVPTPPEVSLPPTTTLATVELPPVPTLVPQVPPELLTPEQLDPFSVNNSRPILPEHVPVIEAYLEAIQVNTFIASQWPFDLEAPELIGGPYTAEILRLIQEGLGERADRGEVLDVSQGVTFRPYVIGPVSETAVVFDCELAGHYWTTADSGEVIPPDRVWMGVPGSIVEVGLRVNVVLRDGRWLVDTSQIDPGACG